jgi:hypothetical protein
MAQLAERPFLVQERLSVMFGALRAQGETKSTAHDGLIEWIQPGDLGLQHRLVERVGRGGVRIDCDEFRCGVGRNRHKLHEPSRCGTGLRNRLP